MLWVVATLLPLAAFAIEAMCGLFRIKLDRKAAYLSTGAIGGAFVLSAIGLLLYLGSHSDSLRAPHHDQTHAAAHAEDGHGAAEEHSEKEEAGHGEENHGSHGEAAHSPVYAKGYFQWATLNFSEDAKEPKGVTLGYYIDNITVLMFFMVTLIATCIHVYSMGYMSHEPRYSRFFMYLSLFCFSMLNLVVADNFFQVFISWELVGVCSYFLIGFYYEKRSASCAANKAFITNRIGDVGFIVGIMAIWAHFGTFRFDQIFTADGLLKAGLEIDPFWLTVAGIGIFIGCVGKSAQFPLHVWLPDAMEGPTPVSALIHAATMVAAGVYFVARVFPLFTTEALLVITYVGGITLFLAATIAIVSTDIKKALAYSTISQLGYMMMALGLGGWVAGLMHLITHAFFKALLFLCSGSVIHGTGTQEMPEMGGLHKKMPITSITMLVGVLAICGVPFFSGFYSKDAIIAQVLAFGTIHPQHVVVLLLPVLTAGITAFYMFRLWFMTFAGEPRDQHVYDHAHESPKLMYVPLIILAVFSVIVAGFPWWHVLNNFISYGQPGATAAGSLAAVAPMAHDHTIHTTATAVASIVAALGIALAAATYWYRWLNPDETRRQFPRVYNLLANKWYFDEIYGYLFVRPTMVVARVCRWFDLTVIDGLLNGSARRTVKLSDIGGRFDLGIVDGLVNLIADVVFGGGKSLRHVQTGWLRGYVMTIAVGVVCVFVIGAYLFTI